MRPGKLNRSGALQAVPKPPAEEILQLEKMQEARRVLQAQALGQQQKKVQVFVENHGLSKYTHLGLEHSLGCFYRSWRELFVIAS